MLHKLFQRTFAVAKEVRTSTDIGASSVSMAAAAVRWRQRIFDELSRAERAVYRRRRDDRAVCRRTLPHNSRASITIANRTLERGAAPGRQDSTARRSRLADLPEHLAEFDIVVSCTASQLPIVGLGMVERAIKARRHRPMFMVDLAVPRDIEAEVADLDDVFLYTVDDLAQIVA